MTIPRAVLIAIVAVFVAHATAGAQVPKLDSVIVKAKAPTIPEFEERRLRGDGHFLTREDLEKKENRRMGEVLSQIPGIRIVGNPGGSNQAFIMNSRGRISIDGGRNGPTFLGRARAGLPKGCYSDVYLDGTLIYGGGADPFDVNSISPPSLEAVEYFSGGATIPAKFNRTGSACGVLILWTRRSR